MKKIEINILKETFSKSLINSVEKLLNNDNFLLKNSTHEISVSGRLSYYIADCLSNDNLMKYGLNVDIEYNRMLDISDKQEMNYISKAIYVTVHDNDPQKKYLHDIIKKYIRPDIIIHKRETSDLNLLWIELKINVPESECGFDIQKTWYALTQLNYKLGISILINYEAKMIIFYWVDVGKVERIAYTIEDNLLKRKDRKIFDYEHNYYK